MDALPEADRAGISTDVDIISLAAHQSTHSVGAVVDFVNFPIDAVLSVVVTLKNGQSVEVGTVGRESFVETDAALESSVSHRTSFCQVSGTVGRMSIASFESRMANGDSFARLMRRNVRATLFSAQQFAACNIKHSLLQRCARWLSMTADRVGGGHFALTHDFLAIMLGVRRPTVCEAVDALEIMGAIRYHRGAVTVLDEHLLNATACECFHACKRAFAASLQD
ncbi:MAG: Crp/Fnr family transcriptional regulator [Candidatus Velthaea sp.]